MKQDYPKFDTLSQIALRGREPGTNGQAQRGMSGQIFRGLRQPVIEWPYMKGGK